MRQNLTIKTALLLILTGLILNSLSLKAQEEKISDTLVFTGEEVEGLFDSDDVLDITIKFDMTEYMRKKPDEYMDAVITFYHTPDDSSSYDVRLRSRGERRRELCAFPPIRINFKNTKTVYGDIDSMKNVKMVTHCNSSSAYDEYLLKEYLIYKMYNLVTEYSFRVRLLRVKYIDTGKRERFLSKYGFFIEPVDLFEQRLNVRELENIHFRYSNMVSDHLDRMTVFQYMIGNTDWQLITYHNMKVFKSPDQQLGIPVAYDFDYSGFVNASYAIPHESMPIKNVRERFFLGACRSDSVYNRIIQEFIDNKDKFYALKNDCELLDERTAKRVNDYLDSFFNLAEKDRLVYIFERDCHDR